MTAGAYSYFAYGSNMSSARLVARVGGVVSLGAALLSEHRHRFSKLGTDGTGKGNVEPTARAAVHGALYLLEREQLDQLVTFETGYRVVELDVWHRASTARAVTFVALRSVEALHPTQSYLEHYRRGMAEHGLPQDYVDDVLTSAARPPLVRG